MPLALGLIGSAAIGAGGNIFGGILGSNTQQNIANQQMQMFQQSQNNLKPYMQGGENFFNLLQSFYGIGPQGGRTNQPNWQAFMNTPDYQWAQQQGMNALNASAASQGQLTSGGQVKAAQEFGQGLAGQQFGNVFNRLLSGSQLGAQAAGVGAQSAGTFSGQMGNTLTQGNQAMLSGIGNATNALSSNALLYGMANGGYLGRQQGVNPSAYAQQGGAFQNYGYNPGTLGVG